MNGEIPEVGCAKTEPVLRTTVRHVGHRVGHRDDDGGFTLEFSAAGLWSVVGPSVGASFAQLPRFSSVLQNFV